jgi:hypothetical protein
MLFQPPGNAAASLESDAETVARGGLFLFGRLGGSPGTPARLRTQLAFDIATPYVGTGLGLAAAELQVAGTNAAAALGCALLRTPVGDALAPTVAAQAAKSRLHFGVRGQARNWRFDAHAGSWDLALAAGIGARLPRDILVAARLEHEPQVAARLAGGFELPMPHGVRFTLHAWRVPGRATRFVLAASSTGACAWRAGFDVENAAASLGCTWHWDKLGLAWGARTHPELGWSHAWTCVRSR